MKITIELYDESEQLQNNFNYELHHILEGTYRKLTDTLLEPSKSTLKDSTGVVVGKLDVSNDYE
jgi:hypothetical protein